MADRFDVWTKQSIKFHNLEAARLALQDDDLLDPFFAAWIQKLDAVDAAREIKCSTAFARELPTHGVNVLMIGESGAGKSTLVKVMTGNEHIVVSVLSRRWCQAFAGHVRCSHAFGALTGHSCRNLL